MKKIILSIAILLTFGTNMNAGLFSSIAGGMIANSMSKGSGSSYSSEGDSGAYFIMLNNKINILEMEMNIQLGISILFLILFIWILIRQGKIIRYQKQLLKKENIDYD
jgi:hypothetical protein